MVRDQPSRYVDYLSYDWEEEDIWSSRKHLLSKRNALKDYDMTWLYGPLQANPDKLSMMPTSLAGIGISKLNSSVNKKSILKKRRLLETMLQQSLPPHRSHIAQPQPVNGVASGYVTSLFSLRPVRRDSSCELLSVSSSGDQSLATNTRKHIHFNDKVERWIVVDVVDSGDDEAGIETYAIDNDDNNSSSDDEFLMMKESARPKSLSRRNRGLPQASRGAERSTIASLPSTTLKYREDTPELTEPTAKQDGGRPLLSLSQKTLRESELSPKILLNNHDENADILWKPPSVFARDEDTSSASHDPLLLNNLCETNRGEAHDDMRRTLSSQMVDAVNSAKDIAFFIWNAG
ncbi:hypothetical protein BGZ57DRAFT_977426 [Hyaloscypha finlandica]|nr:hypothetical protein BGZ57DRAFT_977426 [Hyaloscypha finlandica]